MSDHWYPVMLRLTGKRVLVVGGGAVAARKVDGLLAAGADVTVVTPEVAFELGEHSGITVLRRPYQSGEVHGYALVMACSDDDAVQQQVYEDCEREGVLVNAADDPARCTFILPAVERRGPVVIAVSTSGASPALAQVLRDRLGNALPANVDAAALELERRRTEIKQAGGSTEDVEWRPIVEGLLDGR